MLTKYGKPNEEKTAVLEWYTLGQPFTGPWGYNHHPSKAAMESIGWLVEVKPAIGRFQQLGALDIQTDKITYQVVKRTRAGILAIIAANTESAYDTKKDNITPTRKFRRAVTRAIDLIYREVKFHNYGVGTPLTSDEKLEMQYLGALAARTKALETAEVDIIIESEGKTDEELLALPDDWETAHPDWTE